MALHGYACVRLTPWGQQLSARTSTVQGESVQKKEYIYSFFFSGVQMRHAIATRHNPFSRPAQDPSPIQGRKTEYKKYYCVVDVIGGLTHYQAILKFNSNRPAPLAESLLWAAFQCNSPPAATCLWCAKCARGPQNRAEGPP